MNGIPENCLIREQQLGDQQGIREVTVDAFTHSDLGHHGEANLVETLQSSGQSISLVAIVGGTLIGHVLFTPVSIRNPKHELTGMGLAPMSVATRWQRKGIGQALVDEGLQRLSSERCPFVVVLGHPEYYRERLGFEPADAYGVSHGFRGIPQDVFFIRWLDEEARKRATGGPAYFEAAFGSQHKDLSEPRVLP